MKKILIYLTSAILFAACSTTKELSYPDLTFPPELPPLATEIPVIDFDGAGIKFEVESMFLHNMIVAYSASASNQHAAKIFDESSYAVMKMKFPKGTYECMINMKAEDSAHSAFYVHVDSKAYRVYPSNPPKKEWEKTERSPVYFTIDEPRTITITLQSNSDTKTGHTGMYLDYIQFVKRQ